MFKPDYTIKEIVRLAPKFQHITVCGWVKTFRNSKFITINDGSNLEGLQVVCKEGMLTDEMLRRITTGSSLQIEGDLVASPAKGQAVELLAQKIIFLGESDAEKYPLQPKKHSLTFLREQLQWRSRTQLFHAIFKVRDEVAFSVHQFFREKGFILWHTPIITASDCEGAGEMFRVSHFDFTKIPLQDNHTVDFKKDFFGKEAHLTVSGQLEGELGMMSFGQIYTFSPTFRAENSNTTRHLAEFWMIEPEMAFYDLEDNMNLAEEFVVHMVRNAMQRCEKEITFLNDFLQQEQSQLPPHERRDKSLIETLSFILKKPFVRISYTEAIDILKASPQYKKNKFTYPVEWGVDLQSEHERYLVEKHFEVPVILYNYPAHIKAFYMRVNDDKKTVAAMDVLFPHIGEVIGGSQREERLEILIERMNIMRIPTESINWYLDTRRFGTVPHSGFGLGFERILQFITGMNNIRDVIPFPRYPRGIDF